MCISLSVFSHKPSTFFLIICEFRNFPLGFEYMIPKAVSCGERQQQKQICWIFWFIWVNSEGGNPPPFRISNRISPLSSAFQPSPIGKRREGGAMSAVLPVALLQDHSKYFRHRNMVCCNHPFPLVLEAILGSNCSAQTVPVWCHSCPPWLQWKVGGTVYMAHCGTWRTYHTSSFWLRYWKQAKREQIAFMPCMWAFSWQHVGHCWKQNGNLVELIQQGTSYILMARGVKATAESKYPFWCVSYPFFGNKCQDVLLFLSVLSWTL